MPSFEDVALNIIRVIFFSILTTDDYCIVQYSSHHFSVFQLIPSILSPAPVGAGRCSSPSACSSITCSRLGGFIGVPWGCKRSKPKRNQRPHSTTILWKNIASTLEKYITKLWLWMQVCHEANSWCTGVKKRLRKCDLQVCCLCRFLVYKVPELVPQEPLSHQCLSQAFPGGIARLICICTTLAACNQGLKLQIWQKRLSNLNAITMCSTWIQMMHHWKWCATQ